MRLVGKALSFTDVTVAKSGDIPRGSWLLAEELMDRGDVAFVDELRRIQEPDKLGAFAARWYADKRPFARQMLLAYLDRPLNAFRHEPLVKRLFKLAEAANDDEVMARFLVALDRSIHRIKKTRHRYDWSTRQSWTEETVRVLKNTLPRDPRAFVYRNPRTGERMAAPTEARSAQLVLFKSHTRYYLRRRAWRYFRNLAKQAPDRYVAAACQALVRYTDADVKDGLALLDRWGLVHLLFGASSAIVAKSHGWQIAAGRALSEVTAAPKFEALWQASAAPLLGVMKAAESRPVRQWSLQMLRKHFPAALADLPLAELLILIAHEDTELAQLAADSLRQSPALASLSTEDWLKMLETANPQALDVLCSLMLEKLPRAAVDLGQAVKLACSRPLPIARLGLEWLKSKTPASPADVLLLLQLAEAEADAIRPQAIAWLRWVLGNSPLLEGGWLLELLDSRHSDVRREAWVWFIGDARLRNDVEVWQKLLESPYDEIRIPLLNYLEQRTAALAGLTITQGQLNQPLLQFLWASVLLNVQRGNRAKPLVVRQIVERLQRRPAEAPQLLPILRVALRSARGPEWRAGLAGIVGLIEQLPDLENLVAETFPEFAVCK